MFVQTPRFLLSIYTLNPLYTYIYLTLSINTGILYVRRKTPKIQITTKVFNKQMNLINSTASIAVSITSTLITGATKVVTAIETAVLNIKKQAILPGSVPNKLVSLALISASAYAVGVNLVYISFVMLYAVIFALRTVPRWLLEVAVIVNFIAIGFMTLPESGVTTFEYLVLFKAIFEILCCIFDKLVQAYASLTRNQRHSYYFLYVMFTYTIYFAVAFAIGFIQRLGGL